MRKSHLPKLKKFIDNKLSLKLNGGKHVQEILWEFNPFINLVIDECVEMATSGQQNNTRMCGACLEFSKKISLKDGINNIRNKKNQNLNLQVQKRIREC
uniref:Sm domain-containing protein n=1 Tax=Panthera leo TaxID=9689 RepID=A0A8C8WA68_PANLE